MGEKKYQVFISSTYTDLIEERSAITQCLLDNDCIPVGMEQFPASNMSQMEYIKKMLKDCDYYILILAGRYGSEDEDGIGFTEKEYNYAISCSIPVMSFVVKDINSLTINQCEREREKQDKLLKFRRKVCNGRLVKFYSNIEELKSHVITSIYRCIRDFPAKGWTRGIVNNAITTTMRFDKIQNIDSKENWNIPLTADSFVHFINLINYRIWINAIENADNVCNDEHFDGIFFLYSRSIEILQLDNTAYKETTYKEISNNLLINKALYNIACQSYFYSLCDFFTRINKEMLLSASQDIRQYMHENADIFGEQGLVHICVQKLMMSKKDSKLDNVFWECCFEELFKLYRMIVLVSP